MIRLGAKVYQTCCCPTCGNDMRIMHGAGTMLVTVTCRNKRCADANQMIVVDRTCGEVVEILPTREA